jgi:hypothetical protein
LAVSQQNKTYVVTLMLRVVVGAVSQTRTILIINLTPFSIRNPSPGASLIMGRARRRRR